MKPIIVYVDDEPNNLVVFEATVSEDWEVFTFDSPLKALEKINNISPWVVVSDQRMPGMTGVAFLEIVKKISPASQRAIVTGYSDEDLIINSVRQAQIHDYIRKPWDADDLVHRLEKLIYSYKIEEDLREKTNLLLTRNQQLEQLNKSLETAKDAEKTLRQELEAWAPPFILKAIEIGEANFPMRADIAIITYDIVNSSAIADVEYEGRALRTYILTTFTEMVLKNGGWRDSQAGDSAYAHFGFLKKVSNAADICLTVADEFRLFLRNLGVRTGIEVECGIGLHIAKQCLIDIQVLKFTSGKDEFTHKSFLTTSSDIDLLHRMEKHLHLLPGSSIIFSQEFIQTLSNKPPGLVDIGTQRFKGQNHDVNLFIKPSDKVRPEHLEEMKSKKAA